MSKSTRHYNLLLQAYEYLNVAEEALSEATASDGPYSEDEDLHKITAALYNDMIEDLWKAIERLRTEPVPEGTAPLDPCWNYSDDGTARISFGEGAAEGVVECGVGCHAWYATANDTTIIGTADSLFDAQDAVEEALRELGVLQKDLREMPTVNTRDRMFTITATIEQVVALVQEELAEAEGGSKSKILLGWSKKSLDNALYYAERATHEKENPG